LIQSQGYQLKRNGKDYLLSCPWHDDKEASLVVSPDTNLWHCMGACQTGGSVIDWVMKTQGVSFRLACEILQKDPSLANSTQTVKKNTTTKLASPLAANADNQKLLHQVITYYHETLKTAPEALEYLEQRGLNSPELINTFKLGYANRTLGYRLPARNRKAGSEIRGQLQEIGILRKSGHEHFNGSIVVPVQDENKQITEVYGRKILV
jgi:DNA primase